MKIIYNNFIPFSGFVGINLFGILFIRSEYKDKVLNSEKYQKELINHESIHTKQMKETLYIGFYILYIIFWFINLFRKGNAYRNIPFEKEAYKYESDLTYLTNRKKYNWI